MTLKEYLKQKYGNHAHSLSAFEAKVFGVPYPLESGWIHKWGRLKITSDMAARVLQYFSSDTKNGGRDAFKAAAIKALEPVVGISPEKTGKFTVSIDFVRDDAMVGGFSGQPSFRVDHDSDCKLTVRAHPDIIDDLRRQIVDEESGISLVHPATRSA